MKEYDKTIFPPQLVSEFVSRLRSRSEGKDRFKNRLVRNFEIVQEMCVELNLLPHDYEANLDKITAYFKDESRQYSISYSEDILWVLNKWGHFYSRHRKTFGSTPKTGAVELLLACVGLYSDSKIIKISHSVSSIQYLIYSSV